jgi:hypothetical protein
MRRTKLLGVLMGPTLLGTFTVAKAISQNHQLLLSSMNNATPQLNNVNGILYASFIQWNLL